LRFARITFPEISFKKLFLNISAGSARSRDRAAMSHLPDGR